jgi:hypothetical protein
VLEPLASIVFYLRWILAGVLAVVGLVSIAGNWWIVLRPPARSTSMVTLVGGLCAGVAMLVVPVQALHIWAWVPLVVDPGCGLLVVGVLVERFNERARGGSH